MIDLEKHDDEDKNNDNDVGDNGDDDDDDGHLTPGKMHQVWLLVPQQVHKHLDNYNLVWSLIMTNCNRECSMVINIELLINHKIENITSLQCSFHQKDYKKDQKVRKRQKRSKSAWKVY